MRITDCFYIMATGFLCAIGIPCLASTQTEDATETYCWGTGQTVELRRDHSRGLLRRSAGETALHDSIAVIDMVEAARSRDINLQKETAPCFLTESGESVVPDGYINVRLRDEADGTVLESLAEEMGFISCGRNKFMPNWYSIKMRDTSGNALELATRLHALDLFDCVEPSFHAARLAGITYDEYSSDQWALYNHENPDIDISVSEAWNYATGKGVVIAIIDSGIKLDHPDLADNIYPRSYDAVTDTEPSVITSSAPFDKNHGTACAGIAGAVRHNSIGISGVAPECKLMSISISFSSVGNEIVSYANAINWAWRHGADVISCSWGLQGEVSSSVSSILTDAITMAVTRGRTGKGCAMVFAAGNEGNESDGNIRFPADSDTRIITVGAITSDGNLWERSSYGENLNVVAPGVNIFTTGFYPWYIPFEGTSAAVPHVAGICALILERNKNLKYQDIKRIICQSTDKIGRNGNNILKPWGSWNPKYGYGKINAYKAVTTTSKSTN